MYTSIYRHRNFSRLNAQLEKLFLLVSLAGFIAELLKTKWSLPQVFGLTLALVVISAAWFVLVVLDGRESRWIVVRQSALVLLSSGLVCLICAAMVHHAASPHLSQHITPPNVRLRSFARGRSHFLGAMIHSSRLT